MSNIPTAGQLRQAAAIVEQIETLQAQLTALLDGNAIPSASSPTAPAKRGLGRPKKQKRTMSPEARARIAEAQRKRWAAVKARK